LKNPLAIIVGPTAVGKTTIAVELAAVINAEIISGDSVQVYRGMDIGTNKIKVREQFASSGIFIPHHMLDILEPDQPFSVAQFQFLVRDLIKKIQGRGKIPLIVGGTGLYIQSIVDCYVFSPQQNTAIVRIRQELHQIMADKGKLFLHEELRKIDPKAAEIIHPNDIKRVFRGLETFFLTKQRLSDNWHLKSVGKQSEYYPLYMIGLTMNRKDLYERINARVDKMIADGLVMEVNKLLSKGYHEESHKSMHSIGYREICSFLRGNCSLKEAICQIKKATRRFAKRQLTWFSNDERIIWFDVLNYRNVHEIVNKIAINTGGQHPAM
jgi:tRNA dimethylallyltransferase